MPTGISGYSDRDPRGPRLELKMLLKQLDMAQANGDKTAAIAIIDRIFAIMDQEKRLSAAVHE